MTPNAEQCVMLTAAHQTGGQMHVCLGGASCGSWQTVCDQLHGHHHADTIKSTKTRRHRYKSNLYQGCSMAPQQFSPVSGHYCAFGLVLHVNEVFQGHTWYVSAVKSQCADSCVEAECQK